MPANLAAAARGLTPSTPNLANPPYQYPHGYQLPLLDDVALFFLGLVGEPLRARG